MIVFVKTLTGKTITLDVEASDTIETTIAKIVIQTHDCTPTDGGDLCLVWNKEKLERGHTLMDYNIQKESTLSVHE